MKIPSKVIALLLLAVLAANAQEYQEQPYQEQPLVLQNTQSPQSPQHPNTRMSIYFHPVSLLFGLEANAPFVYLTVEKPFSLYNALIVKPSFWNVGDLQRIGSDIGLRHYLAGRGEGQYLQIQAGAFYLSADDFDFNLDIDWDDEVDKKRNKISALWYDFMGYYGYSYKFAYVSIYSDTGIGYGCIAGACSLLYDINFGIGITF